MIIGKLQNLNTLVLSNNEKLIFPPKEKINDAIQFLKDEYTADQLKKLPKIIPMVKESEDEMRKAYLEALSENIFTDCCFDHSTKSALEIQQEKDEISEKEKRVKHEETLQMVLLDVHQLFHKANTSFHLQDYSNALITYDTIIKTLLQHLKSTVAVTPTSKSLSNMLPEVYLCKAQALKATNANWKQVVVALDNSITLKPTPKAYILKGILLEEMNSHQDAIAQFDLALLTDPSYKLAKKFRKNIEHKVIHAQLYERINELRAKIRELNKKLEQQFGDSNELPQVSPQQLKKMMQLKQIFVETNPGNCLFN